MKYIFSAQVIALFVLIVGFSPKSSPKKVNDEIIELAKPFDAAVEKENVQTVGTPDQASTFVAYAKKLIGTRYLYGSKDPRKGLDCSGFVNCVSNHVGIKVPRSSKEFSNFGPTVATINARPGDLILFTGTNVSRRVVGHMGIVINNEKGNLKFIHSSSGKAKGVIISELSGYYQTRLVKVIRIFPSVA